MRVKQVALVRAAVCILLIGSLVLVGLWVAFSAADYQRDQYFEVREYQAAAAAAGIDYKDVEALTGTRADERTAVFKKLRDQLIKIKNTDSRIRFAYLMRPQGGKMVFLADAEDYSSPDYSPPGQVYFEALPSEFDPYEGKRAPEPYAYGPLTDRWGTWISVTAFILNDEGRPVASLGTDVDGERALASFNHLKFVGILFTVLLGVLLGLVAVQYNLWKYSRDKREALRRETEASMIRLNKRLLEADRMKTEFVEAASHEMRSPVTAINSALQLVNEHCRDELCESGKELVDIALTGSQRLSDLLTNLLDTARLDSGGFRLTRDEVYLPDLINETVKVYEVLAAEKGIELRFSVEGGERTALVDAQAIRRVLENLISNAINYTGKGRIDVEVDALDDEVVFTVRDTGRGIPPGFKDQVFNKFSRLHLSGDGGERGVGLGLSICKGLVEAHGGRIWFESGEGEGTAFHFAIPRHPPDG